MCVYFLFDMFFPIKVASRSKREKLSKGIAGKYGVMSQLICLERM